MCLDPSIRINDYLQPFVERYITVVPELDDILDRLKAGPFEVQRTRRIVTKHARKALRLIENPTFRFESGEFRNMVRELDKASANISYGVITAALIVFAATLSNESLFENWLKATFHLPLIPVLPLLSLGAAGYLLLRLYLRNRLTKRSRPASDRDDIP